MLTPKRQKKEIQDTYDLNALFRCKIASLFAHAIVIYPFVALFALIIMVYLAKSIDIVRLLPLILTPIGTTGGFYLIAKRMMPVDPDWLLLEREKLRLRDQSEGEDDKGSDS